MQSKGRMSGKFNELKIEDRYAQRKREKGVIKHFARLTEGFLLAKQEDSKGARRDSRRMPRTKVVGERCCGWGGKAGKRGGRKGAISWLTGRENVKCSGISRQPCTSFFETDGGAGREGRGERIEEKFNLSRILVFHDFKSLSLEGSGAQIYCLLLLRERISNTNHLKNIVLTCSINECVDPIEKRKKGIIHTPPVIVTA